MRRIAQVMDWGVQRVGGNKLPDWFPPMSLTQLSAVSTTDRNMHRSVAHSVGPSECTKVDPRTEKCTLLAITMVV